MIKWQAIFDPELAQYALPRILTGLPYTLALALIGFSLGVFFGFFIALMRTSRYKLVQSLAAFHVSFMRGTPLMVLLFMIYFGLPFINVQLDAITASILAFTLMSSAYISEIIRSALLAIDIGQWEASRSLGLSTTQIFKRVIIPQAIKICVPPLSNVFLDIVKSTSLTAMITVPEIFSMAKSVGGAKSDYMTVYIVVAFIYWIISTIYAFGQTIIEKKMAF